MLFLREGRLFRSVSFDFVFRRYFRAGCDILYAYCFYFWTELPAAVVIYACIA